MAGTRVVLERGRTWTFASAVDWPGWCRRGKNRDGGDEAALEALLGHADRYAVIAGPGFAPGDLEVVGASSGTVTTDFGAPDVRGEWDDEPLDDAAADRLAGLLEGCWAELDRVARTSPEELRKGPRGGGRDRTAMLDHVREAERSYARSIGVRLPPRTPWDEQRVAIADAVRTAPGAEPRSTGWPVRYFVRRTAWHVTDHAWEMTDRSTP
ncbi:hypothetical protein GCM10027446_03410 [Angustibacter peucedani]